MRFDTQPPLVYSQTITHPCTAACALVIKRLIRRGSGNGTGTTKRTLPPSAAFLFLHPSASLTRCIFIFPRSTSHSDKTGAGRQKVHIIAVQMQMEEGRRIPLGIRRKKQQAYCRNDDVWVKTCSKLFQHLILTFKKREINVQIQLDLMTKLRGKIGQDAK